MTNSRNQPSLAGIQRPVFTTIGVKIAWPHASAWRWRHVLDSWILVSYKDLEIWWRPNYIQKTEGRSYKAAKAKGRKDRILVKATEVKPLQVSAKSKCSKWQELLVSFSSVTTQKWAEMHTQNSIWWSFDWNTRPTIFPSSLSTSVHVLVNKVHGDDSVENRRKIRRRYYWRLMWNWNSVCKWFLLYLTSGDTNSSCLKKEREEFVPHLASREFSILTPCVPPRSIACLIEEFMQLTFWTCSSFKTCDDYSYEHSISASNPLFEIWSGYYTHSQLHM